MAKKYDNDFKVMIVELLKSGRTAKELSSEYYEQWNNKTLAS